VKEVCNDTLVLRNIIILATPARARPLAVRKSFELFGVSLLRWQVCEALYFMLRDAAINRGNQ